jgi:phosphoribosylformylglycinamidine synthase
MIGVVSFPGSNGDQDALYALQVDVGVPARLIDYRETDLARFSGIVLPGGFSYGDYLRCGAIARFAPIMESIRAFAGRGGPVLGICNGFQILTEAHLLPGALRRNQSLHFQCKWIHVRVEQPATAWTEGCRKGQVLRLPIAHGAGAYFADAATLAKLEEKERVVARYCDVSGNISQKHNPNGSAHSIAAICNGQRNVVGLMPHPERATNPLIGGDDGLFMLRAALAMVAVPA